MGYLNAEDRSLICYLLTQKGRSSTRMIKEFPNKMRKRRAVDYLIKKLDLVVVCLPIFVIDANATCGPPSRTGDVHRYEHPELSSPFCVECHLQRENVRFFQPEMWLQTART